MAASGDLVAAWDVPLPDGVHKVEFEHGTTSGKRVITVDGKVISQKKREKKEKNINNFGKIISN